MDSKNFIRCWWLVALLLPACASAQDNRLLYLDWRGGAGSALALTCQETWRRGCSPSTYWIEKADDFAAVQAQVVRDFIPMAGHTKPYWGGTMTCGAATVSVVPPHLVTFCCPSTPWVARVTLTQQCTYADQLGRTSGPYQSEVSLGVNGDCERPAFARTGGFGSTGECYRPQGGPCIKYPENTTTGCNKTTADMYATMPPPGDLKLIFHQAQTCLSHQACNARCHMDNCKWLEVVLPDFVGLYLRFEREWPQVAQACDTYRSLGLPLPQMACAGRMANYHIAADLADALTRHGCGTQRDWDMVYEVIGSCPTTGDPVIRQTVRSLRNEARATCLYRRTAQGFNPSIEEPYRGQVCGQ